MKKVFIHTTAEVASDAQLVWLQACEVRCLMDVLLGAKCNLGKCCKRLTPYWSFCLGTGSVVTHPLLVHALVYGNPEGSWKCLSLWKANRQHRADISGNGGIPYILPARRSFHRFAQEI